MIRKSTTKLLLFLVLAAALGSSIAKAGTFKADYNQAFEELKRVQNTNSRSDIERVANLFNQLTKRQDGGNLLANAFYWEGQTRYLLKDYLHALQQFEKALLVPNSYKEEDARFKVAQCYAKLNWKKAAEWEINRFSLDFPNNKNLQVLKAELHRLSKI